MTRCCEIDIKYNDAEISKNISKSIIDITYTDNEQGKADDLEIVVENRDNRWNTKFFPKKGSKIEVSLKLYNWYKAGEIINVRWGNFTIDELTYSSDATFKISCIAEKCAGSFVTEKKWRTWENIRLKDMCDTLAKENNMRLVYKPANNYKHKMLYQIGVTDSDFILAQCNREIGFKVKIADDKIVIFEDSIGDSGVKLSFKDLSSYMFNSKTFGVYKACEVKYFDAESGEVITYRKEDDAIKNNDSVLVVEQEALSSEEAKKIAAAKLIEANNKEITASISLMGNPNIWTGYEVELSDFGVFSGKYVIDKVTHTISGSQGYITNFDCYLKR